MKKLRIIPLVREEFVPPETVESKDALLAAPWKMEYDIAATLRDMGHDITCVGVYDDLTPIRDTVRELRPHVVFMLLEEFHGVPAYDHAIVSYLELLKQHYTGCNPRGMFLSRDKADSKKILTYHRVPTPRFVEIDRTSRPRLTRKLSYPLLVKTLGDDASLGISQASVVDNEREMSDRVRYVHEQLQRDAIVEEYVAGRELYVGVMGNDRLDAFPVWEMNFSDLPPGSAPIATARVKWDPKYQKRHNIRTHAAKDIDPKLAASIRRASKRVYRLLCMTGYARIDWRLRPDGKFFFLEANANPNLEYGEDFAESAHAAGVSYEKLLTRIIKLGMSYDAPWRE